MQRAGCRCLSDTRVKKIHRIQNNIKFTITQCVVEAKVKYTYQITRVIFDFFSFPTLKVWVFGSQNNPRERDKNKKL